METVTEMVQVQEHGWRVNLQKGMGVGDIFLLLWIPIASVITHINVSPAKPDFH